LNFESLSPIAWEAERDEFDFHVRLEEDDYVIDVFDSSISDPDEAYLTTHACETWDQVVQFCQRYDGISVF